MRMVLHHGRCCGVAMLAGALAVMAGCAQSETPFAGSRATTRLERGQDYLRQKEYDAALAEFQAAVELNPRLAVAHSRIGFIQREKGNLEAAADSYGKAVKLNPGSFKDAVCLAEVYHQLVRLADAIRAYVHACELDPKDIDARLNLGVCYQQSKEFDKAI